jgi:hypothetical protein
MWPRWPHVTPGDLSNPDVQGNIIQVTKIAYVTLVTPCDLSDLCACIDPDGHSDIIHATVTSYVTLVTDPMWSQVTSVYQVIIMTSEVILANYFSWNNIVI